MLIYPIVQVIAFNLIFASSQLCNLSNRVNGVPKNSHTMWQKSHEAGNVEVGFLWLLIFFIHIFFQAAHINQM